jgi:hypothetical protein
VSVEAISWALNLAPIPIDRGRNGVAKPSAPCHAVLIALANWARADGTSAFPSVRRIMLNTSLGRRTVLDCLERLASEGIIRPGNPDIVAAHIRRADRRTLPWDLALERVNVNLSNEDIAMLEGQFPGIGLRVAAARRGSDQGIFDEVRDSHVDPGMPGDCPEGEESDVRDSHLAEDTGCESRTNGVRVPHERGASPAPEPEEDPSLTQDPKTSPRGDVEALCEHLADRIEANGSKRPTITKAWRTACRLLLDVDGRTEDQVHKAIDWCQSDEFWRSNVMSMSALRKQYDALRLKALAEAKKNGGANGHRGGRYEPPNLDFDQKEFGSGYTPRSA